MSYCINPNCTKSSDPANVNNLVCQNCGSELLLQGRYRVIRLLSDDSGFGDIYEVEEQGTYKILKLLKQHLNSHKKALELFQKEAEVLSQLIHPGIPRVEADGYFTFLPRNSQEPLHCLVMEYIAGLDLEKWMSDRSNQPISEEQAIDWLKQIAQILNQVHQQDYFHRDIKPSNIILRPNGQLVLIDFGTAREVTGTYLAKLSGGRNITTLTSAGYTAPEQEKGHAVPQSDFYALGRTFVYLLTGKQPTDKDIYDPYTDELNWRNYAPKISLHLADFIDYLMAPRAGHRPKDTQEIIERLTNIYSFNYPNKISNITDFVVASIFLLILAAICVEAVLNFHYIISGVSFSAIYLYSTIKELLTVLLSFINLSFFVVLGIVLVLIVVFFTPVGWGLGLVIISGLILILPFYLLLKIKELLL